MLRLLVLMGEIKCMMLKIEILQLSIPQIPAHDKYYLTHLFSFVCLFFNLKCLYKNFLIFLKQFRFVKFVFHGNMAFLTFSHMNWFYLNTFYSILQVVYIFLLILSLLILLVCTITYIAIVIALTLTVIIFVIIIIS